jgi:hypothetical protein
MEAALLMLEVVAISQVLIWVARGRGDSGFFAWKTDDKDRAKDERPGWRYRSTDRVRRG